MAKESAIIKALSFSIHTYNSYFQHMLGTDSAGGWKKSNKDHHCFIPTHNAEDIVRALHYVRTLDTSRNRNRNKFLDCGCGIGNIMILAQYLGFKSYGIEYEKENVELARKLLKRVIDTKQVIHGDIMKYKYYKQYDVIYYYEPLQNREKRREFADKISKEAKRGAIVIPNGVWGPPGPKWERIRPDVWPGVYKKL